MTTGEQLAFHVHHDRLVEWCFDYDGRVRVIKRDKPVEEQELRLRLFQPIPEDKVPAEINEVRKTYNEARKAYNEACKAREEALRAYNEAPSEAAWGAYDRACKASYEASIAYGKAREAYENVTEDYAEKLELLHRELCPDCPWDGKTIFSQEVKDAS